MTLTFKLIQDITKVNNDTKFWDRMSNGSAVRITDTQTDGTDSITSTADAGGNNQTLRLLDTYAAKIDSPYTFPSITQLVELLRETCKGGLIFA